MIHNNFECPVCAMKVPDVMKHISASATAPFSDEAHIDFISKLDDTLETFINTKPFVGELVTVIRNEDPMFSHISYKYIIEFARKRLGVDRVTKFMEDVTLTVPDSNTITVNKEKYEKVQQLWQPGDLIRSLNDMITKYYRDPFQILQHFHDINGCSICESNDNLQTTFVDGDNSNFLPSNLEPLCVSCRSVSELIGLTPYSTISKEFSFAGAHRLPNYDGACSNLHGHEWKFIVSVRKKINPNTGMIIDFKDLKRIVTENVVDLLDHNYLNDFFPNPTAENIVLWMWERLMIDGRLKGLESIQLWESPTSDILLTRQDLLSMCGRE